MQTQDLGSAEWSRRDQWLAQLITSTSRDKRGLPIGVMVIYNTSLLQLRTGQVPVNKEMVYMGVFCNYLLT